MAPVLIGCGCGIAPTGYTPRMKLLSAIGPDLVLVLLLSTFGVLAFTVVGG